MTRMVLLAAAIIVAGAMAAQAQKAADLQVRSAGQLAELCGANPREPGADAKINFCRGFAQGAVDVEFRRAGDKRPFCFPPGVTRAATMNEFVSWVRALPQHRDMSAIDGLFSFFGERYPCK